MVAPSALPITGSPPDHLARFPTSVGRRQRRGEGGKDGTGIAQHAEVGDVVEQGWGSVDG